MTFRVGQKVVCVDDVGHGIYTPFPAGSDLEGLSKGSVYTVRDVLSHMGVNLIRVEEIVRRRLSFMSAENAFAAARFRPIVDRKTDISIFTAMLNPSKVNA